MNWEAIGAISELLGSLAVLATLVYLSFQVRNARDELKHSIRQNNEASSSELLLETLRNPRLIEALALTSEGGSFSSTALQEAYDLSREQALVLNNYFVARMRQARYTVVSDLPYIEQSARENFDLSVGRLFGNGAGSVFFTAVSEAMPDDPAVKYIQSKLHPLARDNA